MRVAILLFFLSTVPAWTQAPGWARGSLDMPWSVSDCMARAQYALQSEGYSVDWSGHDARHGVKGPVSVLILCETVPGGGVHYNLIVHTNGSRGASDEGAPLDHRMKNPARNGTGGGVPGGGSGTVSGSTGSGSGTGGGGGSGSASINVARGGIAQQSSTYPVAGASAAGGNDGSLNMGFHTDNEQSPWWQVDSGRNYDIQEVRIQNRIDCCGERARSLMILLSSDGQNWQTVYSNNGSDVGSKENALRISAQGKKRDTCGSN